MEILLELIAELVLDGAIEGAESKNCPRALRIALIIFLSFVYGALIVLFASLLIDSDNVALQILLGAVILLFVIFLVRMWYRLIRKK